MDLATLSDWCHPLISLALSDDSVIGGSAGSGPFRFEKRGHVHVRRSVEYEWNQAAEAMMAETQTRLAELQSVLPLDDSSPTEHALYVAQQRLELDETRRDVRDVFDTGTGDRGFSVGSPAGHRRVDRHGPSGWSPTTPKTKRIQLHRHQHSRSLTSQ